MSWKLNGRVFQSPNSKEILYNTIKAENRVVSGANSIDYIGSEKIYVQAGWEFLSQADWLFLKNQYDDQRLNGTTKILTIDELNINISVIISVDSFKLPIPNNYQYAGVTMQFTQL